MQQKTKLFHKFTQLKKLITQSLRPLKNKLIKFLKPKKNNHNLPTDYNLQSNNSTPTLKKHPYSTQTLDKSSSRTQTLDKSSSRTQTLDKTSSINSQKPFYQDETINFTPPTKPVLVHNLHQMESLWISKLDEETKTRWLELSYHSRLSYYYNWILDNYNYQTMSIEELIDSGLIIESFTFKKGSLVDKLTLKTDVKFISNQNSWDLSQIYTDKSGEIYTDWFDLRNQFYDLSYFKHNRIVHNLNPVDNLTPQQQETIIKTWFSPEFEVVFNEDDVFPFRLKIV